MKSFMQLNENIKFEKNIDIFVEGLVVAYPKLTNEKINYIIRNVGGVNGKSELIEQLISNLNKVAPGSVFNEYMIQPSAAPQAEAPVQKKKYIPSESTPEALKTATHYIKRDFKAKLEQLAKQDVLSFYKSHTKLEAEAYHNLMLQFFDALNDVLRRLRAHPDREVELNKATTTTPRPMQQDRTIEKPPLAMRNNNTTTTTPPPPPSSVMRSNKAGFQPITDEERRQIINLSDKDKEWINKTIKGLSSEKEKIEKIREGLKTLKYLKKLRNDPKHPDNLKAKK